MTTNELANEVKSALKIYEETLAKHYGDTERDKIFVNGAKACSDFVIQILDVWCKKGEQHD